MPFVYLIFSAAILAGLIGLALALHEELTP